MRASVRLFGHSVHQMLIVIPAGLLATSVIFDVIGILRSLLFSPTRLKSDEIEQCLSEV